MHKNIGPWTKAAIGKPLTPQEFLNQPEAQEKVARHQVEEMQKAGLTPGQIARKWIGPGAVDLGTGISSDDYVNRVLSRTGG
jgi:hypothetical protein